jgi:lysophospholipase L1-like esterase
MRSGLGHIWAGGIITAFLAAGTVHSQTIQKLDWIGHNAEPLPLREIGRYVLGYDQDWVMPPPGEHIIQNPDGTTTEIPDLPPSPHQIQPKPYTHYTYTWPGIYFDARFEGDTFFFITDDSENILNVIVDGKSLGRLEKPGKAQYAVKGLDWGVHDVRLEKLTESQAGTGRFDGFYINKPYSHGLPPGVKRGTALEPVPRARQIEFIGDSYTVGYGNTSTKRECTKDEIWATTDTQQAFGPLTAKHYDADYQINAYSGRGIVRNYDGFIGDPLPALYPYALYDGKTEYNKPDWQPQIIMIALGGNDFSTPVHAGEKWATQEDLRADYIANYVTFVKTLRARNPNTSFLLANYGEPEIISDITEVIKRLNADGETRVAPFSAGSNFERTGCDYHLNTADDKRISATLIAYLDAHPDLWQGK